VGVVYVCVGVCVRACVCFFSFLYGEREIELHDDDEEENEVK
jgi:hypothetical protein